MNHRSIIAALAAGIALGGCSQSGVPNQGLGSTDFGTTRADMTLKAQRSGSIQKWHVTELTHIEPPPDGIAVNSAGDVYFTQNSANRARILFPNGKITTLGKGFHTPVGIAPYDSVTYVADAGNKLVKRVLGDGKIQLVGSGWIDPQGVGVDNSGILYVLDAGISEVVRVRQNGKLVVAVPSTVCNSAILGMSVDGHGNIYVSCYKSPGDVFRVAPGGGVATLCSGWSYPLMVTNDDQGDVYVNDGSLYECTAKGRLINIEPDANIGYVLGIAYHDGALYVAAPRRAMILKLTPPE